MWFSRKKQPPIRSLIGETTAVQGELRFREGLRIDGEVRGDVIAEDAGPSLLVVGEKARIHGKVMAGHVIINGSVQGPVEAMELLELQPSARIVGDVCYAVLEMHQGATIQGELKPRAANASAAPAALEDKPVLKLAAANEK